MNKRAEGKKYEDAAVLFLEKHGVSILERNFRCRLGEIDIIGLHNDMLVFFEVKYRSGDGRGQATEAVDLKKQKIISKVSDNFRVYKKQYANMQVRYDVIAIDNDRIKWIPAAFEYSGSGF